MGPTVAKFLREEGRLCSNGVLMGGDGYNRWEDGPIICCRGRRSTDCGSVSAVVEDEPAAGEMSQAFGKIHPSPATAEYRSLPVNRLACGCHLRYHYPGLETSPSPSLCQNPSAADGLYTAICTVVMWGRP